MGESRLSPGFFFAQLVTGDTEVFKQDNKIGKIYSPGRTQRFVYRQDL